MTDAIESTGVTKRSKQHYEPKRGGGRTGGGGGGGVKRSVGARPGNSITKRTRVLVKNFAKNPAVVPIATSCLVGVA